MEKLHVEFEIESEDLKWQEYDIVEKYLRYNGKPTRFKGIVKSGELVGLVSRSYTVIPNEFLVEQIVPLVEQYGYEPIDSPARKVGKAKYIQYFIKPELEKVDGEGIHLGILLRNSIDGTLSLGLEGFSYRTRCGNGVIMGKEAVYKFTRRHVGTVEGILSEIEEAIAQINKTSLRILEKYSHMMRVKFEEKKYNELEKRLPKKDLVDLSRMIGTGTDWDAFNEVTQNIWWNNKGSVLGQYSKMQVVNKVFGI